MRDPSRREREKLKALGVAARYDAAPVIAKVRRLHARGMSTTAMAEQTGLSEKTLVNLLNGWYNYRGQRVEMKTVNRKTYYPLAALRFEPPSMEPHGKAGAKIDAIGTKRRIQALNAAGYPLWWMGRNIEGPSMGGNRRTMASTVMRKKVVFGLTADKFKTLYEKYRYVDPRDVGLSELTVARAKGFARRAEYPPESCWDSDTIDDPDAIPEWTGACGTEKGYQIHYRDRMQRFWNDEIKRFTWACPACREAHRMYEVIREEGEDSPRVWEPKVQGRKKSDHCQRGHDLRKPENVHVRKDGKGRQCAVCPKERRLAKKMAGAEGGANE